MVTSPDRAVMRWLFAFSGVVALLIVFGGFVRLTRSGLSIVEWKPVTGVVPPMSGRAWNEAFDQYKASPEYLKVNSAMTLGEFKQIFVIEWVHRLIARLAGFSYAIPFFVFLARKRIPRRDLPVYLVMGSMFVLQAVAGWLMVASGLENRPSVSHINLTVHLLLAFALLGIALWTALEHRSDPDRTRRPPWSTTSRAATAFLSILVLQIAYGGFTAGLKAGHVSDTWPRMFGKLIPSGLFDSFGDIVRAPATIVFIHRWFAFAVAFASVALLVVVRKHRADASLRAGAIALIAGICIQIVLGITTILTSVNRAVALGHQSTAIALFCIAVHVLHRSRVLDASGHAPVEQAVTEPPVLATV